MRATTRTLMRELVTQRPKRLYRECVFCGAPTAGTACSAHADLLQKDPNYVMKGRAA